MDGDGARGERRCGTGALKEGAGQSLPRAHGPGSSLTEGCLAFGLFHLVPSRESCPSFAGLLTNETVKYRSAIRRIINKFALHVC